MLAWLRALVARFQHSTEPLEQAPAPHGARTGPTAQMRAIERWQDDIAAALAALESERDLHEQHAPWWPSDGETERT